MKSNYQHMEVTGPKGPYELRSTSSGALSKDREIVILGDGIIALYMAFSLIQEKKVDGKDITIVGPLVRGGRIHDVYVENVWIPFGAARLIKGEQPLTEGLLKALGIVTEDFTFAETVVFFHEGVRYEGQDFYDFLKKRKLKTSKEILNELKPKGQSLIKTVRAQFGSLNAQTFVAELGLQSAAAFNDFDNLDWLKREFGASNLRWKPVGGWQNVYSVLFERLRAHNVRFVSGMVGTITENDGVWTAIDKSGHPLISSEIMISALPGKVLEKEVNGTPVAVKAWMESYNVNPLVKAALLFDKQDLSFWNYEQLLTNATSQSVYKLEAGDMVALMVYGDSPELLDLFNEQSGVIYGKKKRCLKVTRGNGLEPISSGTMEQLLTSLSKAAGRPMPKPLYGAFKLWKQGWLTPRESVVGKELPNNPMPGLYCVGEGLATGSWGWTPGGYESCHNILPLVYAQYKATANVI